MCLPANSQTNRLFHPTKPLFSPAKLQFNGVAGRPDLSFAPRSPTAVIPHAGSYSCQADGLAQPHPPPRLGRAGAVRLYLLMLAPVEEEPI